MIRYGLLLNTLNKLRVLKVAYSVVDAHGGCARVVRACVRARVCVCACVRASSPAFMHTSVRASV